METGARLRIRKARPWRPDFENAFWIVALLGFLLIAIGSDLRARAEEALLEKSFGRIYREYCSHTRRFLPGVY